MAESTSNTTTTSSDGTVTITVEKYHDLMARAAEKPAVVHRTVHKTPAVAASENKVWGASLMAVGATLFVVGAVRLKIGFDQASKLVK